MAQDYLSTDPLWSAGMAAAEQEDRQRRREIASESASPYDELSPLTQPVQRRTGGALPPDVERRAAARRAAQELPSVTDGPMPAAAPAGRDPAIVDDPIFRGVQPASDAAFGVQQDKLDEADYLRRLSRQTITQDNPMRAPTERLVGAMAGRGGVSLQDLDAVDAMVAQSEEALMQASEIGEPQDLIDAITNLENARAQQAQAYSAFDPGLLEQQQMAQRDLHQAQIGEAQAVADAYRQAADARREADAAWQEGELLRSQEARERMAAIDRAREVSTDIRDKLAEAQELDPRRWWADLSTAGKIGVGVMTVLAGLLGGLAGDMGMGASIITGAIDRDLELQRNQYQRLQDLSDEQRKIVGLEETAFDLAMRQIGDERAAALVARQAALEQAMAQLDGTMAEWGVHTLSAEQQMARNELEQAIASNRFELETLLARTPQTITKTVRIPEYEAAARRAEAEAGRAGKISDSLIDTTMKGIEQEAVTVPGQIRVEQAKAAAAGEAGQAGQIVSQMKADIGKLTTAQGLLDRVDNLPGVGRWGGRAERLWGSEATGEVMQDLKDIGLDPKEVRGRPPEEVIGRIRSIRNQMQTEIKHSSSIMTDEMKRQVLGSAPELEPYVLGSSGESRVRQD